MYAQDCFHPVAGCAPPPIGLRRINARNCEDALQGDESLLSRSSTSHGKFASYSLVRVSEPIISFVRHCKDIGQVYRKTIGMSMPNDTRSTPFGPLGLLRKRGYSGAVGRWQWPLTMTVGKPHDPVERGTRLVNNCRYHWIRMRRGTGRLHVAQDAPGGW